MEAGKRRYFENRTSVVVIGLTILGEALVIIHLLLASVTLIHAVLAGAFLLFFLFLYRLQIVIDQNAVQLTWGVGAFVKEVAVGDMKSIVLIPNRRISTWLYNPLAELVVAIQLRRGGVVAFAVREPKKVLEILSQRSI